MKDHPTYFENCLPSQLDKVFAEQINTMTESRDEYGRRVYIFRPGRWNPRYIISSKYYPPVKVDKNDKHFGM